MATLAADAKCSTVGEVTTAEFVADATDIYYRGSVVYFDLAGGTDATGKVKLTAAAGDNCAGISPKYQSVTAGDPVEVIVAGVVVLPTGSGVTAVDGGDMLVNDGPVTNTDNPADMKALGDITPAANDMLIGRILKSDGTDMWVHIGVGTGLVSAGTDGTVKYPLGA
jgi:hypothetical protein